MIVAGKPECAEERMHPAFVEEFRSVDAVLGSGVSTTRQLSRALGVLTKEKGRLLRPFPCL